jgi:hypothetical protein
MNGEVYSELTGRNPSQAGTRAALPESGLRSHFTDGRAKLSIV